jgi:hypothetical protein
MAELDKTRAVDVLNRILEAELAGGSTRYSFLYSHIIEFRLSLGCGNRLSSR